MSRIIDTTKAAPNMRFIQYCVKISEQTVLIFILRAELLSMFGYDLVKSCTEISAHLS